MEAAGTPICLVMKAVLLSARWAGRSRRLALSQAAKTAGAGAAVQAENVMLRELIHAGEQWSAPPKTAKVVPAHIERRFFPETRITGFRLAA